MSQGRERGKEEEEEEKTPSRPTKTPSLFILVGLIDGSVVGKTKRHKTQMSLAHEVEIEMRLMTDCLEVCTERDMNE